MEIEKKIILIAWQAKKKIKVLNCLEFLLHSIDGQIWDVSYIRVCNRTAINYNQGRPQDLGGGQEFFFQIWKFACREHTHCLEGPGVCSPEQFFLNGAIWCVLGCILIRFCLYFFSKIIIFYIKKINILDKLLLWGITQE